MSQGNQYGLGFLQAIKRDSQYGEYFSYEEYQALKAAETRETFEAFLGSTSFPEVRAFPNPADTYQDLKLVVRIREVRGSWWDAGHLAHFGEAFPLGCLLLPFVLPVLLFVGWMDSRARLKRLGLERIQLWERADSNGREIQSLCGTDGGHEGRADEEQ